MARLRTIVEGAKYKEQVATLGDVRRLDDILEGVTFALARRPEVVGQPTANPFVWAIPTAPWTGVPLVIYYSFDANRVVLEAIVVADIDSD